MTRQNEEDTNSIWEFLQESAGDVGKVALGGGVVTLIGGVWAYSQVVEMMRSVFGQSAPAVTCVGSALFAVTLGGVTYYFVRKRRGAHPEQPDGQPDPHRPQPGPAANIMDRVVNMMMAPRNPTPSDTAVTGAESDGRPGVREVNDVDQSWIEMKRISEELHVLSLGGTGAGKTVFFTAVSQLAIEEGGKVYVLDGKPGMGWEQKWPNASRKFKNSDMFIPFLKTAVIQMERRIAAGKHRFPGMYIIIDEAQRVTGRFEEAVELVADLSSRGREYNIHVWLLSQAATADLIGFGGKMAVLEKNFTAVELLRENDKYQFSYARFAGGGIRSVGERYITPHLPSPWDDTSDAPVWDDSAEFSQIGAVQTITTNGHAPVQPVVQRPFQPPVQAVIKGGEDDDLVETDPPSSNAPVRTFQNETKDKDEIAAEQAQNLLDTLTDESTFHNGAGFLTIGEVLAIVRLDQAGWTQNRIIAFVLGVKNPQRLTAVSNVLKVYGERE